MKTCYDAYRTSLKVWLQKLTLHRYFGILISGILLFFLINPFLQTHSQLKNDVFQVQWHWLLIAFGLLVAYRTLYVYPLTVLIRGTLQKPVSFRKVFILFHLSNITRYLPGRIWGVVRMLLLSQQFGLSKTAVGGSLALHVGIETTLGMFIAMGVFFSRHTREAAQSILEKFSGHTALLGLILIGIIIGLLFSVPMFSSRIMRFLKVFQEIGKPLLQKLFFNQGLNIGVYHMLLWICQGLAFYLFVRSFISLPFSHASILAACFAFAWVCGFLSFLTPAGLGVREWLLGLLLANHMPLPEAMLVAMLCRVWMLSAEIILASSAFFLKRGDSIHLYSNATLREELRNRHKLTPDIKKDLEEKLDSQPQIPLF